MRNEKKLFWNNEYRNDAESDQLKISPAASPEILHITQYEELGFS